MARSENFELNEDKVDEGKVDEGKVDDASKTKAELIEELVALRAELSAFNQAARPEVQPDLPLIQQEQLWAGFFNAATQANIGWFLIDPDLRYLQINSVLADVNGYSVEHHLGQSLPDILPELAPILVPQFQSMIKTGAPILNLEISGITPKQPDQLRHWLNSYFPLTTATGEVVAIGGIVVEVTVYKQTIATLRERERDLQTAQRLAHVGNWNWDCIQHTGFWSEETYKIHGCDPTQPPPQGADLERYIHPDDLLLYQKLVEQASAGYFFEQDLRIIRPDGEIRYIEARGEPGIFNEQGELLRLFGTVLDVTERKRVEAALRRSEFALKEAQRLAHVGSWSWTQETGVIWTEEVYRIHGLDPTVDLPSADKINKYIHPEDQEIQQAITEAAYAGQPYEFDLRIVRPNGEIRYIEARGEPGLRNSQGELIGLFGTVLDVTERKRVEAQLRQSEANLARAQQMAQVGSWEYDLESQTCTWSEELYRIHQLDPGQPAPVGEAMDRLIHPDDLWIDQQLLKERLLAGQSCEVDLRIVRQDGEVRHIEARGEPILNAQGQTVRWVGTVMDITERKRIEEKLRRSEAEMRAILTAIPDLLTRVKQDGTILFISPGSLQSYVQESCAGDSIYDRLPQWLATERMTYVRRAIETGERQLHEYEISINGDNRYQEARIVAINNEEALVVVRDVTEQRKLERLKAEFISVVSHELRTPLTSMQVALSLLDEHLVELTSKDGQTMIHVAAAGVDRLVRLVNDILDLERLESDKLRIEKRPCDPVDLIDTAINQVRDLANQSQIQFKVKVQSCTIQADPDRLVQVLTNLLGNAIRFSPAHSKIEIAATSLCSGSAQPALLQLSVKDLGRGIPANQLERIFERFQQVDASDSREKSGTGLGLAICRAIIQHHGGQIWAESSLGQGSTFYFTLPLQEESCHGNEAHFAD